MARFRSENSEHLAKPKHCPFHEPTIWARLYAFFSGTEPRRNLSIVYIDATTTDGKFHRAVQCDEINWDRVIAYERRRDLDLL
jgi:hypothetical protein